MKVSNYIPFEFSKSNYDEIYNVIYSKLKMISDEYTIADISLALHNLISDVMYDFEIEQS